MVQDVKRCPPGKEGGGCCFVHVRIPDGLFASWLVKTGKAEVAADFDGMQAAVRVFIGEKGVGDCGDRLEALCQGVCHGADQGWHRRLRRVEVGLTKSEEQRQMTEARTTRTHANTIARIEPALPDKRVYVAGAVLEPMGREEFVPGNTRELRVQGQVLSWRAELFQVPEFTEYFQRGRGRAVSLCRADDRCLSRFRQSGIGDAKCLKEVEQADVLFAWIDRPDTLGTLRPRSGAAYALCKPTFVAFANRKLSEQFYFAKQLASVAIIVSTARLGCVHAMAGDVLDLSV